MEQVPVSPGGRKNSDKIVDIGTFCARHVTENCLTESEAGKYWY